jgi:hypothetical protein
MVNVLLFVLILDEVTFSVLLGFRGQTGSISSLVTRRRQCSIGHVVILSPSRGLTIVLTACATGSQVC